MRELKFRAWDIGNKIMHNNFQFIKSGNETNDWVIFTSDKQRLSENNHPLSNPFFQQQLKIMQYTGLKDKNGVEIYESDIVEDEDGLHSIVYYADGMAQFRLEGVEAECYEDMIDMEFRKVVGNIHENKELLEVKIGQES